MAEIDTSSYPKAQNNTPPLTVERLQGWQQQQQNIERGAIGIDKDKLDLVNSRYSIMSRELQGLYNDPEVDFNKVAGRFQNLVNLGIMPANMMAQALKDVPTDKAQIPGWIKMKAVQSSAIHDAINATYGQPGLQTQGQQLVPTRTGAFVKGGVQRDPNGIPIQLQPPPDTSTIDNDPNSPTYNQPTILGPQAEQPTPGSRLPVRAPNTPINTSPLPVGTDTLSDGSTRTVGPNLSPRYPVSSGIATGTAPLFEEGKKQFVDSQNVAAAKSNALQPLIQAIPLIKNLTTGIGTETINKAAAGLSNLGWLPEGATGKVADYQVINKKLADYLRTSPLAGRSDAAQALSQSASPDPKGQINQALMKLAKDAVALDRIQIAMPHAFEGQDFRQFGKHMSTFPNKVDPKAFNLDMLDDDERTKLITSMDKKLNSNDTRERAEAQKFRRSLEIVDKLKLF